MDKATITLAHRRDYPISYLIGFFLLYGVIFFVSVALIIVAAIEFPPTYSFYFLIMLSIAFGGISVYLFIDTVLFIKKCKINNNLGNPCMELDTAKQIVIINSISGVYRIPIRNIIKLRGGAFFSHSMLSLLYVNKNRRKQILEIAIVDHIRKTKREIKSILIANKR